MSIHLTAIDNAIKKFNIHSSEYDLLYEKVKNMNSIEDLIEINGENHTMNRLRNILIDPLSNPPCFDNLVGINQIMDITYLKKAINIAKTVGRIVLGTVEKHEGIGSSFLIGPGILMTNHHVLRDIEEARQHLVQFDYELNLHNRLRKSFFFALDPDKFFISNSDLDYAVISVKNYSLNATNIPIKRFGWNKLINTKDKILKGENVNIIQHPSGRPKKIAIRENKVIQMKGDRLHYTTDTMKGSSGSMVANDQWEIVGLHSSGVPFTNNIGQLELLHGGYYSNDEDEPCIKWKTNQGVKMDYILNDIINTDLQNIEAKKIRDQLLSTYKF